MSRGFAGTRSGSGIGVRCHGDSVFIMKKNKKKSMLLF